MSRHRHRLQRRARLCRDTDRGWIGGVCAGIANHLGVPVFWVRLLALLPLISPLLPLAVIVYIVMVCTIPKRQEPLDLSEEEADFTEQVRHSPIGTFRDLRHRFRDMEHRLRRMEAYVTSAEYEIDHSLSNDSNRKLKPVK